MSLSIERSLCVNEIGRHVFGVVFSVHLIDWFEAPDFFSFPARHT